MADDVITLGGNSKRMLRDFVKRIEALEEEKKAIADDIKEVYAAVDAAGFEKKAIRRIVRDEMKGREEVANFEAVLDLYREALGRQPNASEARKIRSIYAEKPGDREKRKAETPPGGGSDSKH